jgi:CHAD domain-containing protein
MSSSSSPSGRPPALLLQPEWQRQVGVWRDFLAQCARNPSRKRVHALRSLTLRLRATLEYGLLVQPQYPTAASAFKRWNKEGKKLRRALQPVRDTDVYLAKLDGLRDTLGTAPGGKSKLTPRCLLEMKKLESRLKRRRKARVEKLMAVIEVQGKRLNRLSEKMEAALAPRMRSRAGSTAEAALQIFAGLVKDLPDLNGANLHAYRKRLKPALYLAEISAAADPVAERLAAAFRMIHNASGEWHDWEALALEADLILGGYAKRDGLVPALEALSDRALQRALRLCRRTVKSLSEMETPEQAQTAEQREGGVPR